MTATYPADSEKTLGSRKYRRQLRELMRERGDRVQFEIGQNSRTGRDQAQNVELKFETVDGSAA